ncbi:MAG: hypothetical protein H6834_08135 [Planctomycetes bacterium]|nr:hypothetical protein [Planctomycetota bacterium]
MNISIAYTPDSDDAFFYHALEHQLCDAHGLEFSFEGLHIQHLNRAAEEGRFDVTAASSAAYAHPDLHERYNVLAVGTSLGRGYGPVLAAREFMSREALEGKRVGVASEKTTGAYLLRFHAPGAVFVPCDYTRMAAEVRSGTLDAAVLIHEELLAFEERGLVALADLGKVWCDAKSLPLPVGVNLVHKRLPRNTQERVARAIQDSMVYGLTHREETLNAVMGVTRGHSEEHLDMFANEDSLRLPDDGRRGLVAVLENVQELGLAPETHIAETLRIVDGWPARELQSMLARTS